MSSSFLKNDLGGYPPRRNAIQSVNYTLMVLGIWSSTTIEQYDICHLGNRKRLCGFESTWKIVCFLGKAFQVLIIDVQWPIKNASLDPRHKESLGQRCPDQTLCPPTISCVWRPGSLTGTPSSKGLFTRANSCCSQCGHSLSTCQTTSGLRNRASHGTRRSPQP